jgi:signal transduction histidine kinase
LPDENRETSEVLLSASVELRNMLSVMKMASDLLLPAIEDLGNRHTDRYASMLCHCFYRMLRLTDDLGDLGAIQRGGMPLSCTTYDIVGACRELVGSVRHFAVGSRVVFESSVETIFIYADRFRLDKMLLNLIANSLQNMPQGGQVTLSVVPAAERVVLSVRDNGMGMSSDILPTAWSRYAAPKDPAHRTNGVGLGLTLVQNIARLHGGSAVLESKPGGGTAVTVSLPLLKPPVTEPGTCQACADSGLWQLLTELSGVINYEKYTQLYMD